MNGNGGIVVLIIIGIVLNMVIKAMRSKMKQPTPSQPAPRPDLTEDVDRPFADPPRPPVPHTPLTPQPAPQVRRAKPVSGTGEGMDNMEGVSMQMPRPAQPPADTPTEVTPLVGVGRGTTPNPVADWFRGDGVVRGIIMSEVLNPPVSRRR